MNKLSTKEVMRFAVPVALENLMSQLIGMLVPILIGGISGSALAAVGMGNTVLSLFTSCFAMMSTGGAVLLARAIGAGEKEDASRIGGQSVLMAIVMSMVFAGVFWVIARPVMRLLMPTAEDNMFAEAVLYFRYMMISFPGLMVYSVGTALLRASGTTRGSAIRKPFTSVQFSYSSALAARATIAPVISLPPREKVRIASSWLP